jgi:hypothetical protein
MDGEPLVAQFVSDLEAVVTKYHDQGMTVAEAIGGLEIVKLSVFRDQSTACDESD